MLGNFLKKIEKKKRQEIDGKLLARLSIVLPATAIDLQPTFKLFWDLSEGNGWRLAFLIFGLPLVFYSFFPIFHSTFDDSSWVSDFFVSLISYGMTTIEIALLSLSYRVFSELETPQEPVNI